MWRFGRLGTSGFTMGVLPLKRGEKPLIFYLTTAVYWIIMVFVWQWIFISILESFLLFFFSSFLQFCLPFLFFFFVIQFSVRIVRFWLLLSLTMMIMIMINWRWVFQACQTQQGPAGGPLPSLLHSESTRVRKRHGLGSMRQWALSSVKNCWYM